MRPTPTRRGYAVVAVLVVATVLAWQYGPRSLNAVVAPGLGALLATVVEAVRSGRPSVTRRPIEDGFPGDVRTVTVDVEASAGTLATVTDGVPDAFDVVEPVERAVSNAGVPDEYRTDDQPYAVDAVSQSHATDGGGKRHATVASRPTSTVLPSTLRYSVELDERGQHTFGPATVRVTGTLGLFVREYRVEASTTVVVYPRVVALSTRGRDVVREAAGREAVETGGFESLREYVPGDPMRRVHWKTSAKRPDALYVAEMTSERESGNELTVAVDGDRNHDAVATAAASVVVDALASGLRVGLTTPESSISPGRGGSHRARLLDVLARFDGGQLPQSSRERADLAVGPSDGGVAVTVDDRRRAFERLTDGDPSTRASDDPFVTSGEGDTTGRTTADSSEGPGR